MKKAILFLMLMLSLYAGAQTNIFPSTGRAGINTLSPQASFQVQGGVRVGSLTNYLNIDSATGSLSFVGTAGYQVANNQFAFSAAKSPSAGLFFNAKDLRYEFRSTTGVSNFNIGADANGRVGIGIASPAAKLDILGNIKIADGTQGLGKVLTSDGVGLASWQIPAASGWAVSGANVYNVNAGRVGVNTPNPDYILDVRGTANNDQANIAVTNYNYSHVLVLGSGAQGEPGPQISWLSGDTLLFKLSSGNQLLKLQESLITANGNLTLNGALKIADGTQANGRVLTSDANGLASWQTPSVGWALGGNAGTSTSSFLGTTDNRTMRIRTNNVERMLIDSVGNVVIANAKAATGYKLTVGGKIMCTEVKVQLTPFPDYVFDKNYKLLSFEELQNHLNTYHHLPGMPAASEVETEGMDVGAMQGKIVEKVEENTLYILQLSKENQQLKQQLENLAKAFASLQAEMQHLKQ